MPNNYKLPFAEVKSMEKKGESSGAIETALISLLLIASCLAFYSSFAQTKWYLDDSEPLSYVGVALLMLAVQVIFFNLRLKASPDVLGVAAALVLYAAAAFVFLLLPSQLSIAFWLYRMDLLAFALFFSASAFLLFGSRGALQIPFTLLYAFLAWPVVMLPLAMLEPYLTTFTGDVVQLLTQALGMAIQREPGNLFRSLTTAIPIIILPQCVALSAVLGFITFLLPFAYFLEGKARRKLAWLVFGVVLILLLNLLRIMAVIVVWNYQGITNAVTLFNTTSGNVIFNVALLICLLLFGFFGLGLPRLRGATLFSARLASQIGKARRELLSASPSIIAAVILLAAAALAFNSLDSQVNSYSWLSEFSGKQFVALQANPSDLPIPDDWDMLASESGFADTLTTTRIIFAQPSSEQVQVAVYSSGDKSALNFRAEDELVKENYTVSEASDQYLAFGVSGRLISYSKNGAQYTSICWTQPAHLGEKYTYAAFIITVGDDSSHSHRQFLIALAEDFVRRI